MVDILLFVILSFDGRHLAFLCARIPAPACGFDQTVALIEEKYVEICIGCMPLYQLMFMEIDQRWRE
jgi:hypothetical protein